MKLVRDKRPLYMQVMSILKDRILHGEYPVETNIPSEPLLEQEFQVSKITVRNAIKALVQEGYLETSSGKGTKVIRNTSTSKLSKLKRFTEVLVDEGRHIRKQLLSAEAVDNEAGTEAYRLFGARSVRIQRLYHLDGDPYIHYTHYLSASLVHSAPDELHIQSLYDWLEEQDVVPDRYRDEFAAAAVPEAVAEALRVGLSAVLLKRSRFAYDQSGDLVEYSVGYYNTERHPYVVNYDV
ncbi:GntR family transcriptional regulator [Paenibacillus kobensis]|uniref:GntR family transcriptional regulator n=1 Tax=Paenibacillus kobensis TaxID=59841 RepID=UPI000FD90321|nr:GntR family transcriptional regulator [Paenibacillus kobensis]